MDKRLYAISDWISSKFVVTGSLRPASSDASFRRYFRFDASDTSFIVMDAPPEKESVADFVKIARRLRQIGLNTPEIIAVDSARGYVLMSDLGHQTYLDCLQEDNVDRLYGDAIRALVTLQAESLAHPAFLPPYDKSLLMSEMELFPEWYVQKHLGHALDDFQTDVIDRTFEHLCKSALDQPRVWVHRDFHSRNLMITPMNNPGILDFQDAVTGPVTYDLVSLLKDCYIEWPRDQVVEWALHYRALAIQSGVQINADEEQFITWFDHMGAQRHIKVLGIFARLFHRDGKHHYLGDLPLVWRYLVQVCGDYPELQPFAGLLMELEPR